MVRGEGVQAVVVRPQAEMCSDSFQLLGMAERGFLPAVLARRSRHGTPTLAIVLSSAGVLGLVTFDFLQAPPPPPSHSPCAPPATPRTQPPPHLRAIPRCAAALASVPASVLPDECA